ncbi:MAG: DoxX family protein [Arcicella sp.]|jgi:uncharacterized membrane protein YphA (DoxX/SURF4 family)|nr:DoxX family protein [Arcicella sp.]
MKKTYWILAILLASFFALSGFWEIIKSPVTYPKTLKMGYPPYFITTLGIAKICGSISLLIPKFNRLKEWVFAGFTFDVIFAFISGFATNSYVDCVKSGVAFCIIILTYFLFLASQPKFKTRHLSNN